MAGPRRSTVLWRFAEAGVLTIIAATALPAVASAAGVDRVWNGSNAPLEVSGFGSKGYAYGTWKVHNSSNGTRSRVMSYTRLKNADDHKVYVQLGTEVNAGYCVQASKYMTCTKKYWDHANAETAHHNSSSYVYKTASTGVDDEADYARGKVRAGLDVPWRPDPLTGWSYTDGGDQY